VKFKKCLDCNHLREEEEDAEEVAREVAREGNVPREDRLEEDIKTLGVPFFSRSIL
jgi:hypothetical protein